MTDSSEPIHSGHFMTSNPHRENANDDDEDVEVDVVDVDDNGGSTAICEKNYIQGEKPVTFYKFGPEKTQSIAIDVSLNKLNKCIKVAYMKMTTPKWKDFKGIKLQWKHRIRLNNVIWRAYHMEFRKKIGVPKKRFCYFSVPDEDYTHTRIEGTLLEGMYWKRRMQAVCAQYKRWRTYNRNRKQKRCCRKQEMPCHCGLREQQSIDSNGFLPIDRGNLTTSNLPRSKTPMNTSTLGEFDFGINDDFDDEFTNYLFESLTMPYCFPNPKENNGIFCGNADIMQPGLLSLQPSIEEIMSSADYSFTGEFYDHFDTFSDSIPSSNETQQIRNSTPLPTIMTPLSEQNTSTLCSVNPSNDSSKQDAYSAKEYDAANMLVDYSNHQPVPAKLAQRSKANHCIMDASGYSLGLSGVMTTNVSNNPLYSHSLGLSDVMTTNVSNPLYSQATYQPHLCINPLNLPPQQIHPHQQSSAHPQPLRPLPPIQIDRISIGSAVSQDGSFGAGVPTPLTPPLTFSSNSRPISRMPVPPSGNLSRTNNTPSAFNCPVDQHSTLSSLGSTLIGIAQQQSKQSNLWPQQQEQQIQVSNSLVSPYPQSAAPIGIANERNKTKPNNFSSTPTSTPTFFTRNDVVNFGSIHLLPNNNFERSPLENASNHNKPVYNSAMSPIRQSSSHEHQQASARNSFKLSPSALKISSPSLALDPQSFAQSLSNNAYSNNKKSPAIMSNNNLAKYLTTQCLAPSSPSISLATMLNSAVPGGHFSTQAKVGALAVSIAGDTGNFSPVQQTMAHNVSPASNSNPSLSPMRHVPFNAGAARSNNYQIIDDRPTDQIINTPSTSSLSVPPPRKKSALSSPKKSSNRVNSNFPVGSLGKQSLEIHGTSNLYITSSAGPTTTSNRLYSDSTTNFFTNRGLFPAPSTSNIDESAQLTNTISGGRARWPIINNNSGTPFSAEIPHVLATILSSTPELMTAPNSSTSSSPLTPPLQYTDMTNAIRRKTPSLSEQQSPSISGLRSESVSMPSDTLTRKISGSTGVAMATTPLPITKKSLMAIKEEHEENIQVPPQGSNQLLSSRRRNNALAGSRAVPADSTSRVRSNSISSERPLSAADSTCVHPEERKRILHLHAEKNRRNALKEGFETLVGSIPIIEQMGMKCTNAVVLNRAARHIKDLQRTAQQCEMKIGGMREKIAKMNEKIQLVQSSMPTNTNQNETNNSNMPVQVEQFFERYRKEKSQTDFRFWMMCEVIKPIIQSYGTSICPDPTNIEQLLSTATLWLSEEWKPSRLRPLASDALVRVASDSGAFTGDEKALSNWIMNTSDCKQQPEP